MSIISTLFKQRAYRKMVRDWPERPACLLEVSLDPPSVNGLRFGSHIGEARILGRPVVTVTGGGSDVRLDFPLQGVVLEYEADRLTYVGMLVSPSDDESSGPGMAPARVAIQHRARVVVSPATKAEEIIAVLGHPVDDEPDEHERVLTHQINGCTVELEFTLQNGLKRLNVFPSRCAGSSGSGDG